MKVPPPLSYRGGMPARDGLLEGLEPSLALRLGGLRQVGNGGGPCARAVIITLFFTTCAHALFF